jgi:PD-(D/E)XK endonuclease
MERALNPRQQGDLGEASAIEWLTSRGAVVLLPVGHSPDFDLVAQIGRELLRIQVKTTTQEMRTPKGGHRFPVAVVTRGGNQSWSGVSKRIDAESIDFLFVLTGPGRRWLIPAGALEGTTSISLGGPKYSEYEIDPGRAIADLVHAARPPLELPRPGEYPSGQRIVAVNHAAFAFRGSNPLSPIPAPSPVKPTRYERKLGQSGQAVINQKRRVTIPQKPFFEAGFADGGKVKVRADGPGRIVIEQMELPSWARAGATSPRASPAARTMARSNAGRGSAG